MEAASGTPTSRSRLAARNQLCCRRCAEAVAVTGDAEWGKAVHTATRDEIGADGHLVAPIDTALVKTALARKAGSR
jgi:hypothetical protein